MSPRDSTDEANSEAERIEEVFTFAIRAADIMARNGAPASAITNHVLAVAKSQGFSGTTASITMGQITLSHTAEGGRGATTRMHNVGEAVFDVSSIRVTEEVLDDVISGRSTPAEGLERLVEIEKLWPVHNRWVRLLGWGLMGAGFAWLLGGEPLVVLISGASTALIEWVSAKLVRTGLPSFYVQICAGMCAAVSALITALATPTPAPALIITAALVSRLAGAALLGAVQDLLTGWYLTAAGRLLEAAMNTAGQVIGVLVALEVSQKVGVPLNIESVPSAVQDDVRATLAAALVSAGFALASRTRWSRLPAVAFYGGVTSLVYTVLSSFEVTKLTAAALVTIGTAFLVVLSSQRLRLPPTVTLSLILAPLLPGATVYKGFVELVMSKPSFPTFFQAFGVALSIGAGAVLGQFLASKVLWRYLKNQGERFATTGTGVPDFRRPFLRDEPKVNQTPKTTQ